MSVALVDPRLQPTLPGIMPRVIEIFDPELQELKKYLAWKRVRATSTGLYALLQDGGTLALRRKQVLNSVAAIYNATQQQCTSAEAHHWMAKRGQIPDDGNYNHSRPRFTELSTGWYESHAPECGAPTLKGTRCEQPACQNGRCRQHGGDARIDRTFVACGVLVAGPRRKCTVSDINCITWHVREFSE